MKALLHLLLLSGFSAPCLSAYEIHEWGTFTTVSGSDGGLLTGLHIEEEHLPPFVHSHAGMRQLHETPIITLDNLIRSGTSTQIVVEEEEDKSLRFFRTKGLYRAQLRNVTVKMETPVIYFYGDDTPKVNVKVGFNGGTISQWFPQRKSGDTPNKISREDRILSPNLSKALATDSTASEMVSTKPIDFSQPYSGSIEWDVEILPKSQSDTAFTFKDQENYTWIYPRVPDANMLKVGDQYEDYLFYRGIGNFSLPATFSVDSEETLHIANNSSEAIPFAFAFENIKGAFRYKSITNVLANSSQQVAETDWVTPSNQQVEVFHEMRKGLTAQGLSKDEANAMIKTWWRSYFKKPGLRVFWVVPQQELEKILPLQTTPAPSKKVRVLVGRADILRPSFEKDMIDKLGTYAFNQFHKDRFYLPYKNRLEQLITEPVFSKLTLNNLYHCNLSITAHGDTETLTENISFGYDRKISPASLKLTGVWKIISPEELQIGDLHFKLDPKKGLLSANASSTLKTNHPEFTTYQIQLPKVLN